MSVKVKRQIARDMFQLVGDTPLVYLNRIASGTNAQIAAKLEMFNPLSSVKDRIALAMIQDAEERRIIRPGKSVIIEPSSGNTGIGLAFVASVKGYRCIIVMPESMSLERRKMLSSLGSEVYLTPAQDGFPGAISKARELHAEIPDSWMPLQFDNPINPAIHERTTGREIWNDTAGEIDIFVCGVGTGGTLTGVARYLKSQKSNITIIAVEAEDSAVLSGRPPGSHQIQGLSGGFIANTTDVALIDEVITVSNNNAIKTSRLLASHEGIFVGISSGAAAWAALQIGGRMDCRGKLVVTLFPDSGERYLSSVLWTDTSRSEPNTNTLEEIEHAAH